MPFTCHRRAALFAAFALAAAPLCAQDSNANTPTSTPASVPSAPAISAKQARTADDAYLSGARHFDRRDYAAAESDFARAIQLNPGNADYVRALTFARQARVSVLVHDAALARQSGDTARADSLLAEARKLDPENNLVSEHLVPKTIAPQSVPAQNVASTLSGPIELKPTPGTHDFHLREDGASLLRDIYTAFGIRTQLDPSAQGSTPGIRFDVQGVTFQQATAVAHQLTKTFAVPLQPDVALIARDTADNRERLIPQIEETVFLSGLTGDQMQELANIARNIFDVKSVSTSASAGTILLRADEPTLRLVNAQYADMLDGGSDVLLDFKLYEIDQSKTRNLGVTLPSGAQVFPIVSVLENALNSNQAAINAAIQSSLLNLTGTPLQQKLEKIAFLYGAGLLNSTQTAQLTGLLGTVGTFGGLPLLGVSISSGSTVTALLQMSDARLVDAVELRASNLQKASFRSGSRYPIETAQYTTGVSSSLASSLSGVNVNGVSAASLLAQYGYGSSSVTVPQIQFEDLGLTLIATPAIQRNNDVRLTLDMKIEALGATSINNIPVLNSRALQSTVTVPAGQSALLVSHLSRSELRSIQGLPGLSELPGFSGPEHNSEKDTAEVLIAITPHIGRESVMHIASRPLLTPHSATGGGGSPD